MDHVEMRQLNAAATLERLYSTGPCRASALQRDLGLSRRTLELILDDLAALGWVTELAPPDEGARSVGRPAREFSFRSEAGHLLAVQIDAGDIAVTVTDLSARVVDAHHRTLPIATSRQDRLRLVEEAVDHLLVRSGVEPTTVLAATVSTPGVVRDDGTVHLPVTMPGWTGFSLHAAVRQFLDCPVITVENDAKLAAVGEVASREGEAGDFAYLFSDSDRVGMGLVLAGELHRGLNGAAGELGESPGVGLSLLSSPLLQGLHDVGTAQHEEARARVAAARSGDPAALAEIDELARALLPAISAVSWIVAPEEVVLGGTLASVQDLLIPAVRAAMARQGRPPATRITASRNGQHGVLTGCLRTCVQGLRTALFDEQGYLSGAPGASGAALHEGALA